MAKRSSNLDAEGLDPKEQIFVAEYMIDLDPRRAALAAGYAPSVAAAQAYRWVAGTGAARKPQVYDAIKRRQKKILKKLEVTSERVIDELAKIGFADIRRAARWGTITTGTGKNKRSFQVVNIVDSDEIDDDTAGAIAEVSQGPHGVRLKLHDKRQALVDLGKYTGAFKDGADVIMPVTFVIQRTAISDGKK